MNYRMIFYTVGKVLRAVCIMFLLPIIVSLVYGEYKCVVAFLISAAVALAMACIFILVFKPKSTIFYAKEGFITVTLAWLLVSVIGALPFVISREIPSFLDGLLETVRGFTTKGSSIVPDGETLSNGLLLWRSFTHWIGGMGILVFILAVAQKSPDRSMNVMRAEMPGPAVDKLVPRTKNTALILYIIYVVLTFVLIIFLLCGGMPIFDSVVHAFGTAGTGGFGIKADSIASYSPYLQWVIAIFMLIFGINFNLFYLVLIRKFRLAFSSGELRTYFAMVIVSVAVVCFSIYPMYENFGEVLRLSVFQVSSIITTTGYATADFAQWPMLARAVLVLLMFCGGCAGSTAGGFKISRVIILFKKIGNEIRHAIHPRSVNVVKFEGKRVEDATLDGVGTYLAVYIASMLLMFLLLSIDTKFDFETNATAVIACFNSIGPGLASVGPMANYADYSVFSKFVLMFGMLLGRLEIYPLLILLSPRTWIRK